MHRIPVLFGAVALSVVLAASTVSAAPAARTNRFVGDFDMLDRTTGAVVGHVTTMFTEPSDSKLVPGDLTIRWAPDVSDATFPFMDLAWKPVKESHAQLVGGSFGIEPDYATVAVVDGYLCDYTAPWNADCRPFGAHFDRVFAQGQPNMVYISAGGIEVPFVVGRGTFWLTYVRPTG